MEPPVTSQRRTLTFGVRRVVAEERGIALPLALVVMALLSAVAVALLSVGDREVQISSNHLRATQAQYLAVSGMEEAFDFFRNNPTEVSSAPPGLTVLALAGPDPTMAVSGIYAVQYQSAGTDTALLVSTGTSAGGGERVLRAVLTTSFSGNDAILTGQGLTISGNPTVTGACGSAHANGDVGISGNPVFSGSVTASGSYQVSGTPTVGPGSGGGTPPKSVPPINPTDFLAKAKQLLPPDQIFQLKADGRVLDGNDAVLALLSSGDTYRGWKFNMGTPVVWDLSGNVGFDGTYFLEGDAKVQGNPGSPGTPWQTTIIATEDIEISGTPVIDTHLRDTFLVAGRDVKINGNPDQRFEGLIAAHEQVGISGNPSIEGFIIAEDQLDTSGMVTGTGLSGNPTITYNCGLNPPITGPPQILAWGP